MDEHQIQEEFAHSDTQVPQYFLKQVEPVHFLLKLQPWLELQCAGKSPLQHNGIFQ